VTSKAEETSQAFSALKTTLDKTESFSQPRRKSQRRWWR
jgi:hypothetical protein